MTYSSAKGKVLCVGKSINCNSLGGKFADFLRVRTELLDDLALGLWETLPEKCRRDEISGNHVVCEILRVITAVLMHTNPAPRNLAVVSKGIHRTSGDHTTLLVSLAMHMNLERSLFLRMNSIGITEKTLTAAPKKRRDAQTKDNLCGSKDVIHYWILISYL